MKVVPCIASARVTDRASACSGPLAPACSTVCSDSTLLVPDYVTLDSLLLPQSMAWLGVALSASDCLHQHAKEALLG
eukprot:3190772-Amphidinium_carterae.1